MMEEDPHLLRLLAQWKDAHRQSQSISSAAALAMDQNLWPLSLSLSPAPAQPQPLPLAIPHSVSTEQRLLSLLASSLGPSHPLLRDCMFQACTHLASRIVAVENSFHASGSRTAGVDGQVLDAASRIDLVRRLSWTNLRKFRSSPVRRVFVPRPGGGDRAFGIPTIFDRTVQQLLKLAIEPVTEPFADRYSFGFRKGRCAHMAAGEIASLLDTRTERVRKVGRRRREQESKYIVSTKWVIDAEIEAFFDRMPHSWILENFPMPTNMLFILEELLKSPIQVEDEGGELQVSAMGVPQGGALGPLIANFTLDGLEKRVTGCHQATSEMKECLEERRKGLNTSALRKRSSVRLIRYVDSFVIVTNDKRLVERCVEETSSFLAERGLQLSDQQTRIFPWKNGERLKFLGFIFHRIDRPRLHSRITTQWKAGARKMLSSGGLYVYPSPDGVKLLKRRIKRAFRDNISVSPSRVIKLINPILHGWGNYFGIGQFLRTFSLLDHWVWHRSWRYLRRKFPKTSRPVLVSRYYQGRNSPHGRRWHFHGTWTRPGVDASRRSVEVIQRRMMNGTIEFKATGRKL